MSDQPPVTQRDVARACGVHVSTISLALQNSPTISVTMRQRVQAAVEELGYRPNIAARNLALRRADRRGGGSLPIAWINQEPQRHHWRTDEAARVQYDDACRRAGELGFHLEEIWMHQPGMTPTRALEIVRARGIEGVIFPVHRRLEFSLPGPAWNEFAMVGLNDHRLAEWIDLVCPDYYREADTIFRRAAQRDAGRVGLAVTAHFNAASHELVHSCYLRHQAEVSAAERIPTCVLADDGEEKYDAFANWFHTHQPEVVVSDDADVVRFARNLRFEATWMGLSGAEFPFDGGIDGRNGEAAAAAVSWVVDKMRRFEKGIRELSRVHLTRRAWIEPGMPEHELQAVAAPTVKAALRHPRGRALCCTSFASRL
jgi:LacI family transcriptional regulator